MRALSPTNLKTKIDNRTLILLSAISVVALGISFYFSFYREDQLYHLLISTALLILSGTILYYKYRPTLNQIIDTCNKQNPKLEYSTSLLEENETTGLKQLQKDKIKDHFYAYDYDIPILSNGIIQYGIIAGIVTLFNFFGMSITHVDKHSTINKTYSDDVIETLDQTETTELFEINKILLRVTPPVYTGINAQYYGDQEITVPEHSILRWSINTNRAAEQFYFMFSDNDTLAISYPYTFNKVVDTDDFYRFGYTDLDSSYISEYYSIKIKKDQPPKIAVKNIKEYLKLPWGPNHDISFEIEIEDDYGLDSAMIVATVAKGSGESVKFREKKYPLVGFQSNSKNYKKSFTFSSEKLDMEPGSELYFYVLAKDICPFRPNWTKSITHFVSIEDTTQYEYVDDASMQVDLMPDFFRSQRQIIIDSEELIASKSTISVDSFNKASNALGFDQKMLRLKYGQFLGEENESGIAIENEVNTQEEHDHHDHDDHDHDHQEQEKNSILTNARDLLSGYMHDHDHEEEEGLLMSTKGTEKEDPSSPSWVKELSHNHDNTEEATFHGMSVKNKLRAALSEMWDAELHLRLYDPGTSLPYQYNSLKLLQEIKNHARIYVHRIGFDPPIIKENEKRLSGDLDEINPLSSDLSYEKSDLYLPIKEIIQQITTQDKINEQQYKRLIKSLSTLALSRPEILPVLSQIQSSSQNYSAEEIRKMLIRIIPEKDEELVENGVFSLDLTKRVAKEIRSL